MNLTIQEDRQMNYSLSVPRFNQKFSIGDWPKEMLIEGKNDDYWSDSCCGLACLRMIFAYYRKPVPTQLQLLEQGLNRNYYNSKGWIHQGLADLGKMYGLKASPLIIKDGDQLEHLLATEGPVIVSITHKFPENGSKGGHLIVVCGRNQTSKGNIICFRDPSRWGESNSTVSEDRFFSSFSGRTIVFSL